MKAFKVNLMSALLGGLIFVSGYPVHAVTLFSDDFSGANLGSIWEVQKGFATMDNGWVRTQGSTPGSRDAYIMTHEGDSTWANYEITTRFNPLGGGDDWYNGQIVFRVQNMDGWVDGTYYRLWINTPSWGDDAGRNTVSLLKHTPENGFGFEIIDTYHVAPGVLNDNDNTVQVRAIDGDFDVTINGMLGGHFHDDNPILTGGIALGSVWESTTRYDYVNVTAVPEPETYAMLLAGLGIIGFMSLRRKESAI
ncbi:PEP-CTERM sorting domain-containing protein [Nitrosomonas ureae]|uniref:PEP-CTERM protein-sorting domain-containing protein n=1 Tax=Nitrosomonas ureae TaxID=44577 RepID=A0A1H9C779_9PROT|nr:PEP-CTERM sorting domain-containing protein [Nitrosomonas ureae]SEP97002.1 PEP-CTERM protein-sorting domain-containing protein [Nitrosomonas ureae]